MAAYPPEFISRFYGMKKNEKQPVQGLFQDFSRPVQDKSLKLGKSSTAGLIS